MRLYEIARAIERVGAMELAGGTELSALHLVVPVVEVPQRTADRFWRSRVERPPGLIKRWLQKLRLARRATDPHHVRISWVSGRISGAILPDHPQRS